MPNPFREYKPPAGNTNPFRQPQQSRQPNQSSKDAVRQALERARAAGNESDVRVLERALQGEPEPNMIGRAAEWVSSTVKGPEGLPDLPLFEAEPPTTGGSARIGAALTLTPDAEAQADIFRKEYPGIELEPVEADGKKYYIANYTDPETGKTSRGYINQPGADIRDVTRFVGQTAMFAPGAGAAARATGLIPRMLTAGGTAAGTQYGMEKGAQALGSEQPTDWASVATAGGAAAGFEAVAPLAKAAWRSIFRNSDYFSPRTGKLTPKGRQAAVKAGLDPDSMPSSSSREFGRLARDGGDPEAAARAARQQEFGIRGTRGQTAQDYTQLNTEERIRRGLQGEDASRALKRFDVDQAADIDRAASGVQLRLAGGNTPRTSQEAGEAAMTGLRQRAATERQGVNTAYEAIRGPDNGRFGPQALRVLDDRMTVALRDFDIDPTTTPAAARALQRIRQNIGAVIDDGASLRAIEAERKALNSLSDAAANKADRTAISRMRRALDGWIDDAVDKGLFEGDPAIIQQLKEARGLRRAYSEKFEQQGKDDLSGAIVERIMNRAETPEEAMNYVFGQSGIGNKGGATGALQRLRRAFGEGSDEWNAMREAAWLRLTRDKRGDMLSPQAFESAYKQARNQNASLMGELFSPEELAMMNRYRDALKSVQAQATNPSQTAFALENAIRYTLRRFGQRESFTKGNVGTGTLLNFMARMPLNPLGATQSARERVAQSAMSPLPSVPRRAPGVTAGGTAAVQNLPDKERPQRQRPKSIIDTIMEMME